MSMGQTSAEQASHTELDTESQAVSDEAVDATGDLQGEDREEGREDGREDDTADSGFDDEGTDEATGRGGSRPGAARASRPRRASRSSSRRGRSRPTTSRASSTSPTSTATSTWTSRATARRSRSSGGNLKVLIGRDGAVLEAVQELTRLAVLRETGERSRLMLDIGGYRAARRTELTEHGREAVEEAKSTGKPVRLAPMTPFERKIVHDAVAEGGLRSESEGEEPERMVVVYPE